MRIIIKKEENNSDICFDAVWELQDNGKDEIVLKNNDHSCVRVKKKDIEKCICLIK